MRISVVLVSFILSVSLLFTGFSNAESSGEKKRRIILEKMEKLRNKKAKLKAKEKEKIKKIETKSKANRSQSIKLFERIIASTRQGDSRRCDALFQIGALYYEDSRDKYIHKQNRFSKLYSIWEKSGGIGAPPVEPVPTYARCIKAYKEFILGCPTNPARDIVLYKIGNIFTALGDFESAFQSFNALVKEYPKSENLPFANLRIGEYYYMKRDNDNAIKHYKAVGTKSGAGNYLLSLYRVASCYYNMSKFDTAIKKFFEYVELADSGKFKNADFRDESIEYMAISFSENENGAKDALKFFKKKGGRDYQDYILYTIGIKNRDHDNIPEAIKSLYFLLEHYPNYIDAPKALKALIDCYIIEKEYEKANKLRERLITEYGPGSKWARTYRGESEKVEDAKNNIKEAASIIPLYYHKTAFSKKDSAKSDITIKNLKKALFWYNSYMKKFPSEKWNIFTFRWYKANILGDSLIGRYGEAAKEYRWVSREDTSSYPDRKGAERKLQEESRKKERDIKKQFNSNIKEKVATVKISSEESGFYAIVCMEKLLKGALKKAGLSKTNLQKGFNLPEMQEYLREINSFKNRFPNSIHSSTVAFLESNIYFEVKKYRDAIRGYSFIVNNFEIKNKVFKPSLENLAKSYLKNKEYSKAISVFKRLLHEFASTNKNKKDMIESIAAAMFQVAESKKKQGHYSQAADIFKQTVIDYPDFSKCDVALFNAAHAYETGKLNREAAREFERVFDKFPKSKFRKEALLRSAAAYKSAREFENAAKVFLKYKTKLPSDPQALPSIFRAAFMYDSAGNYMQAAKTYELVYNAYLENKKNKAKFKGAKNEAPGALYNAGFIYEKAKKFRDAITTYKRLEKTFPTSPVASDAYFSIAICYDSLGNDTKMAEGYISYTQKYGTDKARIVASLMKAAKAYKRLNKKAKEEEIYRSIIKIQEKFGKSIKYNIDPQYAAECYFVLGERAFDSYAKMDLRTTKRGKKGSQEIVKKLKAKTGAMGKPLKLFINCIALQTDKWTTKSTHMCGELFWNLMEVVKRQPILERDANKKAYAKVKVNEALSPYYNKTMEQYFINVNKFRNEMGILDEWTKFSAEKYARCWYELGMLHIENGNIFNSAPNPFPKGTQEFDEYHGQIKNVVDKLISKCIPVFENGIKSCAEIYVNNSWVERMKKELEYRDSNNKSLKIVFRELPSKTSLSAVNNKNFKKYNAELNRNIARINSIFEDKSLSVNEKTALLHNIESDANRKISRLSLEIKRLK